MKQKKPSRTKLGDPVAYVLSAAFMVKVERDGEWQPLDDAQQASYRFLAEAVRAGSKARGT